MVYKEVDRLTPNESTSLLQKNFDSVDNSSSNHIIFVSKEHREYEPIFSINDYPTALTLEELLPYDNDPWWQRLRKILFLSFWIAVAIALVSGLLTSYLHAANQSCLNNLKNIESNVLPDLTATTAATIPPTATTIIDKLLSGVGLSGSSGVIAP